MNVKFDRDIDYTAIVGKGRFIKLIMSSNFKQDFFIIEAAKINTYIYTLFK